MGISPTNKELFSNGFINLLEKQEEDVRLMACDSNGKTALFAHKLILSAKSKVFEKMFESDKGKSKTSTKLQKIAFSDLKHEELEAFVDFIYSDGSTISKKDKKHVMKLYHVANKYEIPHLSDLCRNILMSSLNALNALKVLKLAEIHHDKALIDAALVVIKNYKNAISTSTEFEKFETLTQISLSYLH